MSPIKRFFTKKEPKNLDMEQRITSIEQTLKTIETYLTQINDKSASSIFKQIQESIKGALREPMDNPHTQQKRELKEAGNPPIIIDQLHVDKIIVQKLEYSNNFGQLGIQELTGKLNIGTSHEGEFTIDKKNKLHSKLNEKVPDGPEVKFQSRKE